MHNVQFPKKVQKNKARLSAWIKLTHALPTITRARAHKRTQDSRRVAFIPLTAGEGLSQVTLNTVWAEPWAFESNQKMQKVSMLLSQMDTIEQNTPKGRTSKCETIKHAQARSSHARRATFSGPALRSLTYASRCLVYEAEAGTRVTGAQCGPF